MTFTESYLVLPSYISIGGHEEGKRRVKGVVRGIRSGRRAAIGRLWAGDQSETAKRIASPFREKKIERAMPTVNYEEIKGNEHGCRCVGGRLPADAATLIGFDSGRRAVPRKTENIEEKPAREKKNTQSQAVFHKNEVYVS